MSELAEQDIRRALRLDADETPPRLDPRAIAAAARASRSTASTGIVVAASAAFVAGWIWSEIFRALVSGALGLTGVDLLGGGIDLASGVLVRLAPVAQAATAPAVPIAILTLAVIAAAFERTKGTRHATPS
ncbi:MAG: hypothetical protein KGJ98_03055 [Chloroflexota bacterium]|nr:hypothetical protein [Chloroflexota bacterium]MDE3101194.1 hypothetical protein [Chloroflexota bacterium]